jgi:hypothetical protein
VPFGVATRPKLTAPAVAPPPPPPSAATLTRLRALSTTGRRCGPHEVAPGVWVSIDCERHTPIAGAKIHASSRKASLFRRGLLRPDDAAHPPQAGSDRGEAALPTSVDHRADGLEGPIKFQDQVGACSGFSLSAAMDNAIRRLGKTYTTSAAHVWAHYGRPSWTPAAQANAQKGIASTEAWPFSGTEACRYQFYDPSPASYPCGDYYGVKQGSARNDPVAQKKITDADATGSFKMVAFDAFADHPANVSDLMATLATGVDLWVALELDIDYWRNSALGADYAIHDCVECRESHGVTLAGYRTTPRGRQFLIHNSWGTSWGDGGYAWVSENAVKNHMWAYKVTMAEIGAPSHDLTDDDCAEDELVDSVNGECGKICPDDSRPAGGKCPS